MPGYALKDELAEMRRAAKDAGITDPRAEELMNDDFKAGEFTIEQVDSYCVGLKAKLAKLPADGGNGLGEHADDIVTAFAGKGDAAARSRLVKTIGQDKADEAAKRFGLSGVGDFSRAGVTPDDVKPPAKDTNPYSDAWQKKHTPDELIDEIKRLTKIRGTPFVAGLAKNAGTDIAGRKLRGAA